MERRPIYPVDTANFKWIREHGMVYVDKTTYIHTLTRTQGKYYFLARPRRFGKSLLLDTLAEYFKGNRTLFKGLAIDQLQPEEWESYPVLRLNMTGINFLEPQNLTELIGRQLSEMEKDFEISRDFEGVSSRFNQIIAEIHRKSNKRVVILIDEYDAPLSGAIGNGELQENYREQLHGFYSVLKNCEEHIKFCFLTGVTRYGKVSVFSGLNNLKDITFSNDYAGICGITREELRAYYAEGVKFLAEKKGLTEDATFELLKFYYDGYHFSSSMLDIYNPYSLNNALADLSIEDYWCRSGVPTILSKSLMHDDFDVAKLAGKKVIQSELSALSMHSMNPVSLFYQTGYLTIKGYEERRQRYTLGYPNREVEAAIMRNILKVYTHARDERQGFVYDMEDALEEGNPQEFVNLLSAFLADIPSQLHKHVARYENYYHTIFYCLTTLMGLDVEAEYSTSEGFIDILVKTAGHIYIIELKVNGTAEDAMEQIEARHYAAPFATDPRQVVKIGLGFSTRTHNVASSLIR